MGAFCTSQAQDFQDAMLRFEVLFEMVGKGEGNETTLLFLFCALDCFGEQGMNGENATDSNLNVEQ